jgi:hypothetical protein
MPSQLEQQCLIILTAAASAAVGIVVGTNNPTKARAAIYKMRRDFANPEFDNIHIRVSPDNSEGELWLIQKDRMPTFAFSTAE